jgi:hypothetical protein
LVLVSNKCQKVANWLSSTCPSLLVFAIGGTFHSHKSQIVEFYESLEFYASENAKVFTIHQAPPFEGNNLLRTRRRE